MIKTLNPDMSNSTYVKGSKYNQGYHDARMDMYWKRENRSNIEQGKLYNLPLHNKPYCEGYKDAWTENKGIWELV